MTTQPERIPVTILTGFLGAGKTTLLNYLLQGSHGLKMAVLVNDFGSINIDAELIVGIEGEKISLQNGCICCTIRDDLAEAVIQLAAGDTRPEYILIETSGVADPVAVAQTFTLVPELGQVTRLDTILTVIDGEQIRLLSGSYERLAWRQIAVADVVVLNKKDLVSPGDWQAVKEWVKSIVPQVRLWETTHGRIPLELIFESTAIPQPALEPFDVHVHEQHSHNHHHHHHHPHTLIFDSWAYQTEQMLSYQPFYRFLKNLPTTIYRAKGVVYMEHNPEQQLILHMVGTRLRLTKGGEWRDKPRQTRLVFIGQAGSLDVASLTAGLEGCQAQTDRPGLTPSQILEEWLRQQTLGVVGLEAE